jgi:hypothetical protein
MRHFRFAPSRANLSRDCVDPEESPTLALPRGSDHLRFLNGFFDVLALDRCELYFLYSIPLVYQEIKSEILG